MSRRDTGFDKHDQPTTGPVEDRSRERGREPEPPLEIPWLAIDAHGRVHSVVYAANAIDASAGIPPGTSLYIGGPSAAHPGRPLWTENWRASRALSR